VYSLANHPIDAALLASADAPNHDLLLHFDNLIEDSVLVFIEMKSSITGQIVPHLMPATDTQLGVLLQFAKSHLDSPLNRRIKRIVILFDQRLGPYQAILS